MSRVRPRTTKPAVKNIDKGPGGMTRPRSRAGYLYGPFRFSATPLACWNLSASINAPMTTHTTPSGTIQTFAWVQALFIVRATAYQYEYAEAKGEIEHRLLPSLIP